MTTGRLCCGKRGLFCCLHRLSTARGSQVKGARQQSPGVRLNTSGQACCSGACTYQHAFKYENRMQGDPAIAL